MNNKRDFILSNKVNIKNIDNDLICIYGNEDSSNYFINTNELLKVLSTILYDDEFLIEKALLSQKFQKGKTYTFWKDENKEGIEKYSWCQRPADSNMSLCCFTKNGEVCGFMSESLAETHGLTQIDLNEFIHSFVKPILKETINLKQNLKDEIENTNKEIEWQKENGNVATREKLEYKLEILKSLETK